MKAKLTLGDMGHRTVFEFESGPYDAIPPVDQIFVQSRIRFATADRIAIATVLLLRDYVSFSIDLPKPCSPEVAGAITQFLSPLNAQVQPVDLKPVAKPIAERTAVLRIPNQKSSCSHDIAEQDLIEFGLADDQAFSSSISVKRVALACNLRVFSADNGVSLGLGILGLCILFAEDFGIGRIIVPDAISRQIPNFLKLQKLTLFSNIELISEGQYF